MQLKQISVPIENSPNRLHAVVKALADEGIQILAMSVADNGDRGHLRLIVADVPAARRVVMRQRVPARMDEVLAVAVADTADAYTTMLSHLMAADVQIHYAYTLSKKSANQAGRTVVVLQTSDNRLALRILRKEGLEVMDESALKLLAAA